MEFLESLFGELLEYPGAFVRWVFLRKRMTFREIFDDGRGNGILGFLLIAIIVASIYGIIEVVKYLKYN